MKIYAKTVGEFIDEVENRTFLAALEKNYRVLVGKVQAGEYRAWQHSVQEYMYAVIKKAGLPADAGIAVEYQVPGLSERVDLIITGFDDNGEMTAILIELKQWSAIECCDSAVSYKVQIPMSGGSELRDHPCYQINYYKNAIAGGISEEDFPLHLCPAVVLHNYSLQENEDPLFQNGYKNYMLNIPVFFKGEDEKLESYLAEKIKSGDNGSVLTYIETKCCGISLTLLELLKKLSVNDSSLRLNAEQQRMQGTVMKMLNTAKRDKRKKVVLVQGGPGTGKSVVALKILAACLCEHSDMNCYYTAKNKALRAVLRFDLSQIAGMERFSSSIVYPPFLEKLERNKASVITVDEAHRLSEEKQIVSIIKAAVVSVFFIDEGQIVSFEDIGTKEVIMECAKRQDADIIDAGELQAQFRCRGMTDYIQWVDALLENEEGEAARLKYDIQVEDDFKKFEGSLEKMNRRNLNTRIIAGYCWEWSTRNDRTKKLYDFNIENENLRWNNDDKIDPVSWAIGETFDQIGCIHTCQGLEFCYVGVIIGEDLRYEKGKIITDISKRATDDFTVSKRAREKFLRKCGKEATMKREVDIVKNTYRVLLTRGTRGCKVYCMDKALGEHIKERISKFSGVNQEYKDEIR